MIDKSPQTLYFRTSQKDQNQIIQFHLVCAKILSFLDKKSGTIFRLFSEYCSTYLILQNSLVIVDVLQFYTQILL